MNSTENTECGLIGSTLLKNEEKHGKDTTTISGIYKIINEVNGKYYIGSSEDIRRRIHSHFYELRSKKHGNKKLQLAWNKYGESVFRWIIMKEVSENELLSEEQIHLDECKLYPNTNYNICYDASAFFRGKHHTIDAKNRIGNANRGRPQSSVLRQQRSQIMKGRYSGSKNPNYKRKHTPEEKAKMIYGRMDKTKYIFRNITTNELFVGTRIDFGERFVIDKHNVFNIVHRRSNNCNGWIISK